MPVHLTPARFSSRLSSSEIQVALKASTAADASATSSISTQVQDHHDEDESDIEDESSTSAAPITPKRETKSIKAHQSKKSTRAYRAADAIVAAWIRRPIAVLVFWALFYPAVFAPWVYQSAWPMQLETDFNEYLKSETKGSLDNEAVEAVFDKASDPKRRRQLMSTFSKQRADNAVDLIFVDPKITDQIKGAADDYTFHNGNVFTVEYLQQIREIENEIRSLDDFERWCFPLRKESEI